MIGTVITLDEESDRFKRFAANNKHMEFSAFKGIRGRDIPFEARIRDSLQTSELAHSGLTNDGALGSAASHREVWKKAANTPSGMLIMEDDVITHPRLPELIDKHIQFFEKQDIVHFTLNTDSVLHVESPAGLSQASLFAPRYPEEDWIKAALSRTNIETVGMWRLLNTFGMCCYFLSARGAEKLLHEVFPLRLDTTKIPLILQEDMPQYSLDRRMNALYQSLNAHMCMPFLAFTPNCDSTTRPADPLPEEEMADTSV